MPKPYVHLLGPPLDVALDARIVGDLGGDVNLMPCPLRLWVQGNG
jgi:hypothetical protein